MSGGGPFPPYPADVAQLEAIGDRITRHGSRAASVGRAAAQRGRVAGTVDSFGLFDDIVASVQPATIAGTSLQRAGKVASLALSAWAGAVRGYDRQVRALNAEWQAAKANDFGVGGLELDRSSMKPAEVDRAVSGRADDVADARADLWADLVRRRHRAKRGLDAAADDVAALLNAGPDALDTALAGVGVSGDISVDLPDLFGSSPTDGEEGPSTPIVGGVRMSNLDNLDEAYGPVDWVETLAFLFADPRECVGDDASIGGCGLEVATLVPWFKPLKAAKIAKYADEMRDAERAADDARVARDADIGHAGRHQYPQTRPRKSQFYDDADLSELGKTADTRGVLQPNGNTRYVIRSTEDVGVDRTTGLPTDIYTVIRGPDGRVITIFPGTSAKS